MKKTTVIILLIYSSSLMGADRNNNLSLKERVRKKREDVFRLQARLELVGIKLHPEPYIDGKPLSSYPEEGADWDLDSSWPGRPQPVKSRAESDPEKFNKDVAEIKDLMAQGKKEKEKAAAAAPQVPNSGTVSSASTASSASSSSSDVAPASAASASDT